MLGQTLTDVGGRFTLEVQSSSGRPCLRVEKEGYAARSMKLNEPIDGITLPSSGCAGRRDVVEVDGGPVAGARVWAPGTAALTDANGRFVLDGVGEWLSAQAEGYSSNGIQGPEGHDMAVGTPNPAIRSLISVATGFAGRISSNDIDIDLLGRGQLVHVQVDRPGHGRPGADRPSAVVRREPAAIVGRGRKLRSVQGGDRKTW